MGNCLAASSRDLPALGCLGNTDVIGPGVSYSSEAFFEDRGSVLNIWQCVRLGFLCPFADLSSGSHCQGLCQDHGARAVFFSLGKKLKRNFSVEDNIKVDLYLEVCRDSYGRMYTKVHPHRLNTVFIGFGNEHN